MAQDLSPGDSAPEPEESGTDVSELSAGNEPRERDGFLFKLRGPVERYPRSSMLHVTTVKLTPKAEFNPGLARGDTRRDSVPVKEDDLIEIEFDQGERLWLRADDYLSRIGYPASRGAPVGEVLDLKGEMNLLPAGMQARGPVSWVIKSLKVLGIDLAGKSAVELAKLAEPPDSESEEQKGRPASGLHRCAVSTRGFGLTRVAPEAQDLPWLVLIHGAASSTWGSFGDLWAPERKRELGKLRESYGERVLAFEHATLTKSPIENALELARALPKGARLHLVTHSRGGLIGELLCRSNTEASSPFLPEELRLFDQDKEEDSRPSGRREQLEELGEELKRKRFTVERFVRVACPALGTTLASGRLDRWFSVIGTLAGRALPDTPLFDFFKDISDFMAAVIKERTDPSSLPGLEAMMPDSLFIKLINWPRTSIKGDLTVISGDIDPAAWWARIFVFLSDRFYEGDHDLVVNTASMYGGSKRSGNALVSFHKDPHVNHFRYFQNQESAQRIIQALTAKEEELEGFELLRKPTTDIARAITSPSAEPRPVVFILPGIMGSELTVESESVWLNLVDLIFGGFGKLHISAPGVRPSQPFARHYGGICLYLAQTHKVVPFPFDWRISVEKEADRLAEAVRDEFENARRNGKPVRILAHSMGGLVARTMIARHESLWRDVCSVPGARLVMLGTPNGGSHAISELLVGRSSTLRKLSALDTIHSHKDLLDIIRRFPGVLAMLPRDQREDYFAEETWKRYHDKAGEGWLLPERIDFENALKFRQLLDKSLVDPEHMIYVAGSADVTICQMVLDQAEKEPGNRIKFLATTRGDGRVTWDTGILSGAPTWYMDVEHGDLAAHEESFQALHELLANGKTTLLSKTPPVSRGAEELFPMPKPPDSEELYPDEEVLTASLLGSRPRKRRQVKRRQPPVTVRVVHGNLAFASHPVAVGHYAGDTINSAERQLDLALDNALSRRHQLGIYPGAVETSAIHINPKLAGDSKVTPKGAIVLGLGTPGSLSASALTRSFMRALLDYVTEWSEYQPQTLRDGANQSLGELKVSPLLIGTGAGGITVMDSVFSLLRGVSLANKALENAKNPYRVTEIEFIELYEHMSLLAVNAIKTLKPETWSRRAFTFNGRLECRDGGQHRVLFDETADWWHRLHIMGGNGDGALRFSASTRRARNEVRLLPTQKALVDSFIAESIRTTQDRRAAARTLFELLLPNELKEQAPDEDNLVLILDEEAARYPWELLEDPWNSEKRPMSVEHGLLRQLESTQFRESVRGVIGNRALVIGDPVSKFPELKGAQKEAQLVSAELRNGRRPFDVVSRIRPESKVVLDALFDGDYKVLHLAGHGVYRHILDEDKKCKSCGQPVSGKTPLYEERLGKRVTGMVIGDNVVLSPGEVRQMRHVPELVFINCCFLGYVEADAEASEEQNRRSDYNRIAANIATEFIRMGVRAVIAAGWAVDDAAAETFAVTFYGEMLQGCPFGKAVLKARGATFDKHGETNTWGAYQCYGDPDYRLIQTDLDSAIPPEKFEFVTPSELVVELNNFSARLPNIEGEVPKPEIERLRKMVKVIEQNKWLGEGRICAALGRAFGQAKCFEDAIKYYHLAMGAEDAGITLRDVEQLANFEIRHAAKTWQSGGNSDEALKAIEQGVKRLKSIQDLCAGTTAAHCKDTLGAGRTSERLCLLGSAYKRRAWISPGDRKDSLEQMIAHYRNAFQTAEKALADKTGRVDTYAYALLNWVTGELVKEWQKEAGGDTAQIFANYSSLLGKGEDELKAELEVSPNLWVSAMLTDSQLLKHLFENQLDDATTLSLAGQYLEVKKNAAPSKYDSIVEQIDFLIAMAGSQSPVHDALVLLRQKL